MTYQEMLAEIPHLTIEEQLKMIEALTRSVQTAFIAPPRNAVAFQRLQGSLRTSGTPPTDQEVDQMIADALTEKHM